MKIACLALNSKQLGGATTFNLATSFSLKNFGHKDSTYDFFEIAGRDKKAKGACNNNFTALNYRKLEKTMEILDGYDLIHILSGQKYKEGDPKLDFIRHLTSKKKWIITLHGISEFKFYPWLKDMMGEDNCVGWISTKEEVTAMYDFNNHSATIPICIPSKAIDRDIARDKWVFAARIAAAKGIVEFLKIADVTDEPVEIYGRGYGMEEYTLLQKLDEVCGENPNITFHGEYQPSETRDIYSDAKLAFDLSKYDNKKGIQYVDLEAMKSGAILVCFDSLNLHPSVDDAVIYINREELLNNPEKVVGDIVAKISDSAWVNNALDIYERVLSTIFSPKHFANKMDEFYKEVCK